MAQWLCCRKKLVPAADTPPPPSEIRPHAAAAAFSAAPILHVLRNSWIFQVYRKFWRQLQIIVQYRNLNRWYSFDIRRYRKRCSWSKKKNQHAPMTRVSMQFVNQSKSKIALNNKSRIFMNSDCMSQRIWLITINSKHASSSACPC